MTLFDASGKEAFRKHCGKKRKLLVQAISPFPTMFSTLSKLSSANAFNLVWFKILSCGKGLSGKCLVCADIQTDGQADNGKTICPRPMDAGH